MKKLAMLGVAATLMICGAIAQPPDDAGAQPASEAPPRDQRWLKQLVGEWDLKCKIYLQQDQPPAESTGTDSVRALGEHWIIAEAKATMMGMPYNGVLSLGYNAHTKQFNGTWIDSFAGQLWIYKGTLNEAGDTMTLETEGPSLFEGPDKTAQYKEIIHITGANSRTFTSTTQAPDGKWVTILTIEYQRKAKPAKPAE